MCIFFLCCSANTERVESVCDKALFLTLTHRRTDTHWHAHTHTYTYTNSHRDRDRNDSESIFSQSATLSQRHYSPRCQSRGCGGGGGGSFFSVHWTVRGTLKGLMSDSGNRQHVCPPVKTHTRVRPSGVWSFLVLVLITQDEKNKTEWNEAGNFSRPGENGLTRGSSRNVCVLLQQLSLCCYVSCFGGCGLGSEGVRFYTVLTRDSPTAPEELQVEMMETFRVTEREMCVQSLIISKNSTRNLCSSYLNHGHCSMKTLDNLEVLVLFCMKHDSVPQNQSSFEICFNSVK